MAPYDAIVTRISIAVHSAFDWNYSASVVGMGPVNIVSVLQNTCIVEEVVEQERCETLRMYWSELPHSTTSYHGRNCASTPPLHRSLKFNSKNCHLPLRLGGDQIPIVYRYAIYVYCGHSFFCCFLFMSFINDMFREYGFAFCVSEVLSMFFKSCIGSFCCSSYIKFVAIGACQFINPLPFVFVIVFCFIWDYVV